MSNTQSCHGCTSGATCQMLPRCIKARRIVSATETESERASHTPGPWVVRAGRMADDLNIETPGDFPRLIAVLRGSGRSEFVARHEADARLIASVTELLAELQAFVAFIDPEGARTAQVGGPYYERLVAARAAIAKATTGGAA